MASRRLEVEIIGDSRSLEKAFGRSSDAGSKFGKSFGTIAKAAGVATIAAAGVAVVTKKVADAAIEAERVQAQLETQMRASGQSMDTYGAAIDQTITKLSTMSGLDDEDLTSGFTKLVRASGDAGEAMKQMTLVADLARARNIEVSKAADIVAKAMAGNTGILKRYGVEVEKGASVTAALASAQQTFAGQAQAYGNTTAGAQDKIRVSFENVQESIGKKLLPAYNSVLKWAADQLPKISAFFDQHSGTIHRVLGAIGTVINANLVPAFNTMKTVAGIVWTAVKKVFDENGPAIERILDRVKTAVKAISTVMQFLVNNVVLPILKPAMMTVLPEVLGVAITAIDKVSAAIEAVIKGVKWVGQNMAKVFKEVTQALRGPMALLADLLSPVVALAQSLVGAIRELIKLAGRLKDALSGIGGAIGGAIGAIPGLAAGGPVAAGSAYVVGERGPELFVPTVGGTIIPNHAITAGGSLTASPTAGGSPIVNVYVNNGFMGPGAAQELARIVKRELALDGRRNVTALGGLA
jgi:phage-related protein